MLALIDVGTRVILGYSLCLRREYGRYDVIRTLEKALSPAQTPRVSIPDLEPIACGGFASVTLPETVHACWRQIRFDNARAHLAEDSLDVACEILGCTVDVGPAYEPDDRPFIERFFGTVATQFTHRLPGTTGSSASDVLRKEYWKSTRMPLQYAEKINAARFGMARAAAAERDELVAE